MTEGGRVQVMIRIDLPVEELYACLQAMRGWERGREAITLAIAVDAPQLSPEQMRALFSRLQPPLPYEQVWTRPEETP